jgi:hypothetical protein
MPSSSRSHSRDRLARELVGHWPLRGDARDHSGHGNHGIAHGSRAADSRFNGTAWTSVGRFLDPADYQFRNPNEWARVTSLTLYAGKLFASMGSCTSSHLDAPADFRGKIFAMQAGQCVSYDRDLGSGWRHLAAVRRKDRLELYLNGSCEAESVRCDPAAFDLSTHASLRIGAGEVDCFSGRIREVRLYRVALAARVIRRLAESDPHP